jgi:hypothetical protein
MPHLLSLGILLLLNSPAAPPSHSRDRAEVLHFVGKLKQVETERQGLFADEDKEAKGWYHSQSILETMTDNESAWKKLYHQASFSLPKLESCRVLRTDYLNALGFAIDDFEDSRHSFNWASKDVSNGKPWDWKKLPQSLQKAEIDLTALCRSYHVMKSFQIDSKATVPSG